MARSTFEGPVLSGDVRFGQFRNVGSVTLTQNVYLNLLNTTPNTAGYSGGSGVFADSNGIPNMPATVYVPNSSSTTLTTQAIPTDTASQIYRGWVCYVPAGCDIDTALIDVAVVPTVTSGTISTIKMYVSNNYTVEAGTPTYGSVSSISATGRQTFAYSASGVTNSNSTSTDIVQPNGQANVSQIVFTLSIAGTTMTTLSAGQIYLALRYVQPDGNIGTATAYPYGNFD
jgi:hypothetical protein